MSLLLDTHIFLWFISGDTRLPNSIREAIRDPANCVFLSVASLWEAIIKSQLGKLPLPSPAEIYLPAQRERHGIANLAIDEADVIQLAELPPIYRDPFDRLVISQANRHGLTLATVDPAIRAHLVALNRNSLTPGAPKRLYRPRIARWTDRRSKRWKPTVR
jgi:PIN domain nuclease of toxin-antitoxin system